MIYGFCQSLDDSVDVSSIATNVLCDYSLTPPKDAPCHAYTEAELCLRLMLLEERLNTALRLAEDHGADTATLFREDALFSENITDVFSEPYLSNP